GGIASKLDYKMSDMVEYMSIMTCKLYARFLTNANMSALADSLPSFVFSFRKFVLQVLTSTRLPCATCLLALSYLSNRLDSVSQDPAMVARWTQENPSYQLYALLTVALVLANKFLDDNTFTNQSWSQVSGLPCSVVNKLEREWLASISWSLNP
ncbi:cyclin Clg1, partial [Schizosaccharomyces japonicus yFS275]